MPGCPDEAPAVVGLHIAWIDGDRVIVVRQRKIILAFVRPDPTPIGDGFGIMGIEGDRLAKVG